jgi:DNA-binding NarL/FixJ family response regulator
VPPIRVLVVDDHPAVRAGLCLLVDAEPGMHAVGSVPDAFGVAPAVHATGPDVVLMDYQLPGADGISLCRALRRGSAAPAVLLYTAFADESMLVPARLAGVGAIADKGLEPRALALLIRRLAAGEALLDEVTPELLDAAAAGVGPADEPILRAMAGGLPPARVAASAGLTLEELDGRVEAMLERLVVLPRGHGG